MTATPTLLGLAVAVMAIITQIFRPAMRNLKQVRAFLLCVLREWIAWNNAMEVHLG